MTMWPFFKNKAQSENLSSDEEEARRPLNFQKLLDGMGNLAELAHHDTATKFWLPEPAERALTELAGMQSVSMSAMLREFFSAHCYGVYVIQALRRDLPNVFKDNDPRIRFSISGSNQKVRSVTYWVPELGKNVAPVKIWIAKRLRDDLLALAEHTQIPLSQYLREIVISRLLGHGMLPKRPEMLQAAPLPSADAWCDDQEVPWIEVNEETYRRFPDGRTETEWEDE